MILLNVSGFSNNILDKTINSYEDLNPVSIDASSDINRKVSNYMFFIDTLDYDINEYQYYIFN